jgi:hypothetical protein
MAPLHRYWLFVGTIHYACGGIHDLHATYPTVDAAMAAGVARQADEAWRWWHVIDAHTGTILAASAQQAYGVDWPPAEAGKNTPHEGT